MYKRPFFVELPNKHEKNRGIVKRIKYAPAMLSNGEPGIMTILGNTMTTMSADEVREVTSRWLDALEESEAKHDRDSAA
jgi:hypothetical protein